MGDQVAEPARGGGRVTIADIAHRAGVSKGAVSYALNNRPGVSADTRRRILDLAEELGWYPHSAARALTQARVGVCGLVLARPAQTLAFETFFMELIAGIEAEVASAGIGLLLQVVVDIEQELAIYRRWWAERRVDGVILVDLRVDDPRVDQVERLGLPAVVVGGPEGTGGLSAVWSDDDGAVVDAVRYLARLGHRWIARVGGVPGLLHTEVRTVAYQRTMAELGLPPTLLSTDYTPENGAQATRDLLTRPQPPTAIVYDNDVLAVAGLSVAHEMGLSVPGAVSLVAWDDSLLCKVVHPPLSAVSRDITAHGADAARALLTLVDGGPVVRRGQPRGRMTPRGTTGPPAAA